MYKLKSLFDSLSFLKIVVIAFFGSGLFTLIYLFAKDVLNTIPYLF